ncbi:YrhA family protein [Metabacillus malikii]|uniref:SMI1/KNR4 family protein n=1 Tax=Metabacillus malikii TaxID=1504265 RepID=A0ABT9ZK30_9BACI|nr:YrhA family protein [Metabacillus malikii]MDQ0232651.1 hypothetical protein [Metabacillus malikii]
MWQDKLIEIEKLEARFGDKLNNGASAQELRIFTKAVKERLNIDLLPEHLQLLRNINGLEFNGFIIYGIDEEFLDKAPNASITGLIDSNEIWYENEHQKQYLFIGDSTSPGTFTISYQKHIAN